jgi:phospholipase/carboxylesterase
MSDLAGFAHRFVAPEGESASPSESRRALLLLHGTGGDENDLLPLGRLLDPTAALLSPRGRVLENGMPRFFRRLREGVFDEQDVRRRARELAEFVRAARHEYDLGPVVAVGFSNGANIAAAVLLLEPGGLEGAVLLSPMVPLEPEDLPDLAGTRVLIVSGRKDPMAPAAEAERLASLLRRAGAEVALEWHPGGHELGMSQVEAARRWLAARSWPTTRS